MRPNDRSSGSADSKRASSAAVLARRLAIPLFTVVGAAFGAWALIYTGATNPMLVGDSGPLGRIGLPIAEFFFQAASVVVIGAIILMMLILPRSKPQRRRGAGARRAEKKAKQLAAKKAAAGKSSAAEEATAAATLTAEVTSAAVADGKNDRDVELDPSWAAALLTAQILSLIHI